HVYCLEEKVTAHRSSLCANLYDSCSQDNNDTLCGKTLKQLCEDTSESFVAQRGWACDWKDTALNGLIAALIIFALCAIVAIVMCTRRKPKNSTSLRHDYCFGQRCFVRKGYRSWGRMSC
ncbi:MAG: hypothetical protein P8J32_00900, partial [bacterium]|nr:hypothetical protein [bacterium]